MLKINLEIDHRVLETGIKMVETMTTEADMIEMEITEIEMIETQIGETVAGATQFHEETRHQNGSKENWTSLIPKVQQYQAQAQPQQQVQASANQQQPYQQYRSLTPRRQVLDINVRERRNSRSPGPRYRDNYSSYRYYDDRNNHNRDNYYQNRDRSDSRGRQDYRNNYYRGPSQERGRQWTSSYDQRRQSVDRYQRPYDNNYQQRSPQQQQFKQQPMPAQLTNGNTISTNQPPNNQQMIQRPSTNILSLLAETQIRQAHIYSVMIQDASSHDNMPTGTKIATIYEGDEWRIPIKTLGDITITEAQVGSWKGKVLLDTGSARSVIYANFAPYVAARIIKCNHERSNGVSGSVSIKFKIRTTIKLFCYEIRDMVLYVMDTVPAFRKGIFHAIIGGDVLRQLPRMTLDCENSMVRMPKEIGPRIRAPNNNDQEPICFNTYDFQSNVNENEDNSEMYTPQPLPASVIIVDEEPKPKEEEFDSQLLLTMTMDQILQLSCTMKSKPQVNGRLEKENNPLQDNGLNKNFDGSEQSNNLVRDNGLNVKHKPGNLRLSDFSENFEVGNPINERLKDFKYEDPFARKVEQGSGNLVNPVDKLLSFSVDKWIKYADQLDP